MAVRKLRISYTSQNDDHGLGTLGRTLLASSVSPWFQEAYILLQLASNPYSDTPPATEYQPNSKIARKLPNSKSPRGRAEGRNSKDRGGGGWLGILLPSGLGNSRAPCQPAEHPHEKCRFRVGAEAEGQSSGSCTIALGFQPPQQVLEGLCRERAKQAPHRCKIRTGLAPTHPGFPA